MKRNELFQQTPSQIEADSFFAVTKLQAEGGKKVRATSKFNKFYFDYSPE